MSWPAMSSAFLLGHLKSLLGGVQCTWAEAPQARLSVSACDELDSHGKNKGVILFCVSLFLSSR